MNERTITLAEKLLVAWMQSDRVAESYEEVVKACFTLAEKFEARLQEERDFRGDAY
jgi:hypothetical protein